MSARKAIRSLLNRSYLCLDFLNRLLPFLSHMERPGLQPMISDSLAIPGTVE